MSLALDRQYSKSSLVPTLVNPPPSPWINGLHVRTLFQFWRCKMQSSCWLLNREFQKFYSVISNYRKSVFKTPHSKHKLYTLTADICFSNVQKPHSITPLLSAGKLQYFIPDIMCVKLKSYDDMLWIMSLSLSTTHVMSATIVHEELGNWCCV